MRIKVSIALLLGMTAVVLGAFASHGLKAVLTPERLVSFEVGIRYQMIHALLLLIVLLTDVFDKKVKLVVFWLTTMGVLLFSGSIYLLNLQDQLGLSLGFLGPITPLGGSLLILAWGYLAYKAFTCLPR
ncbi:MAG: DUF423 domain-containing protein [Bacteroidetes bacterium]|nr:DUF423 domain-containing protein [Bacteroidota bacterium]